jgi:hypothetical protein
MTHYGWSAVYCAAMFPLYQPLQLLLLIFAGNRHQSDVIEYLQEENRVLKERLVATGCAFSGSLKTATKRCPQRST